MDRLGALRIFAAVAQRQSFAEAARGLHISPTAASRAVAELEQALGVALLRRTTRSVTLTPEGAAYLERCRLALDELDDAERSLRGEDAAPRGRLVIAAPVVFGRVHIMPIVTALLRAHPALDVQLTLADRVVRLVDEGIDVAVRIGELSDSALHAVPVDAVRRVLVASPDYLVRRGVPGAVADLRGHEQLTFDALTPNGEWRFGVGERMAMRCAPRMLSNNAEAVIAAALDGLGVARAFCYQVDAHVRAGRLKYLLCDQEPPAAPVNLLFQANRQRAPNVPALVVAAREYFHAKNTCPT